MGPVLNRAILAHERVECIDGQLYIRFVEKIPDVSTLDSLDYIFDSGVLYDQYAAPAMITLNDTWHVGPHISIFDKDAKPFKVKETGRIMMPIRFFTEAIGGEVGFKDGMIRLSYKGTEVLLRSRDTTAYINGEEVQMDQAPHVLYGRTMVPLRFVLEAFGATVTYNRDLDVANIELEGADCLEPTLCRKMWLR